MKKGTAFLFFIFLFSLSSFSQITATIASSDSDESETRFTLTRDFDLEKYNKSEEVEVEINEGASRFKLRISSKVASGKLKVEIYNAEGEKKGVFSVGSSLNSNIEEVANGKIHKTLNEPKAGIWKVKLIPINAKGHVRIHTETIYKG